MNYSMFWWTEEFALSRSEMSWLQIKGYTTKTLPCSFMQTNCKNMYLLAFMFSKEWNCSTLLLLKALEKLFAQYSKTLIL